IAFNPISALARATMIGICRHDAARRLVIKMMRETCEVAERVGCKPRVSIERRLAGAERAGEHKTSTLQDLERGRPLELDVILSAVVELADLTGAEVPTLRAIHAVADLLNQQLSTEGASRPPARTAAGAGWRTVLSPHSEEAYRRLHTEFDEGIGMKNKRAEPYERLTHPLVREDGAFRRASWDEALDRAAEGFRRNVEQHGPDAFAMLSCARSTNEMNYVAQKFTRVVIGTNNVDSC